MLYLLTTNRASVEMKSASEEGGRERSSRMGYNRPHRRSQLNLGNEEGRGEKELSSESGDWKRGDTRATQPPPSNVVTSIWEKFLKGRKEGETGAKS